MWALDEDLDVDIEKDLYIQNNRIKNDLLLYESWYRQ